MISSQRFKIYEERGRDWVPYKRENIGELHRYVKSSILRRHPLVRLIREWFFRKFERVDTGKGRGSHVGRISVQGDTTSMDT